MASVSANYSVKYTYDCIKVFKTRFVRLVQLFTSLEDYLKTLDDWDNYIKVMSDDIKEVPLILMEIESIDSIIESIDLLLNGQ